MAKKKFTAYMVCNIRTGDMRLVKTMPQADSPYEVVINTSVTVEIPDRLVPRLDLKVELPAASIVQLEQQDVTAKLIVPGAEPLGGR